MLLLVSLTGAVSAQGTAFTYQGKLADSGVPANGNYDFEFKLFDTATVGTGLQQGSTLQRLNVAVVNGVFNVSLDFGACASCFNGTDRFLEISVKSTGGGVFTLLGPRQPITSTPYALKSANAGTADGLSVICAGCVTSSQIGSVNGSALSGVIPVASVPSGSGSYVQNSTSQQATSNFNISGDGTAGGMLKGNIVTATSQFNIGAARILSVGSSSIYIGPSAGTTGGANSFVGSNAGQSNTSGNLNSFFGGGAGDSNLTGSQNTFIGVEAHATGLNSTGDNNSLLGAFANVTSGMNNATAIGARALVTQSNSLVLGAINGINNGNADTNVGIGTTAPTARLHIVSGASGTIPNANASLILDSSAGHFVNILGPDSSQTGVLFGNTTGGGSVAGIVFNNPAIPDGLQFRTGGSASSRLAITNAGDVGIGTGVPADKLHVLGIIRVQTLGAADTTTALCRNSLMQIATCNSSSVRYKTDIAPFIDGLDVVNRLRPISFTWKQSGTRDIGFGAEEVARVAPLFTFTNEKGEIEGVKYDRITVLLVNAIKQQQQQIVEREHQAAVQEEQIKLLTAESSELTKKLLQIKSLEEAVRNLKKIVCLDHPGADVCR